MALLKVAHVSGDGVGPDRVRRLMATLAGDGEGIVDSGDFLVSEKSGTPNMSVDVATGRSLVTGTEATTQGSYLCETDTVTNLVIADGDASNPRIDVVVAQVRDSDYSGVDDDWRLFVVVGTPAGSPVAPAIPANSLKLGEVTVDALESTSILDADISDSRIEWVQIPGARLETVAFEGRRTTNLSISTATWTEITLLTETTDTHDGHVANSATYTIPAGQGGWYAVTLWIDLDDTATDARGRITVTGINLYSADAPSDIRKVTVSGVVPLAAGDTIIGEVRHDAGSNKNLISASLYVLRLR